MKLLPLAALPLLAGCAAWPPAEVIPPATEHRAVASGLADGPDRLRSAPPGFGTSLIDARPVAGEIRIVDSRMIRELVRSDPLRIAVSLTGPQKAAVIAGATIVGVYLISEWIEDNVAFFP